MDFNIGKLKQDAMRKAFGIDLEKSRTGVYEDNAENRRLNRVGQHYGHKAEEEQPGGKQPAAKEEQPQGAQKQASPEEMKKHAAGASDEALKRAAADPKASLEVKQAAQEEMKNRGVEGDKGNAKKGEPKTATKHEILKDFKRISANELWDRGYDSGDAKEIYFKTSENEDEIILINEDGGVTHDKVDTEAGNEDVKEYGSFEEFASANGMKVEKSKEESEKEEALKSKTAIKAKRAFIKNVKETGGSMQLDEFMNDNVKYFSGLLEKYGAEDITDLGLKLEEKYADSEKDPYGEKLFTRLYDKCMNSIPAEVYLEEVEKWSDMRDFVRENEEYFKHKSK